MRKFEYKTFRCRAWWNGGEYRFEVLDGKDLEDDWVDADNLGKDGWEFISFIPGGEVNFAGSFSEDRLPFIKAGIFKREIS